LISVVSIFSFFLRASDKSLEFGFKLDKPLFDIENIQSFGELFCKYLNELGISEDSYEIDDDWSFIYLKLS
jgi:hypothetical protein